jgi:hypothetical protein
LRPQRGGLRMAKTVTIGDSDIRHLSVSQRHLSPLCGASYPAMKGRRRSASGDVTCIRCKRVLEQAVKNVLASA